MLEFKSEAMITKYNHHIQRAEATLRQMQLEYPVHKKYDFHSQVGPNIFRIQQIGCDQGYFREQVDATIHFFGKDHDTTQAKYALRVLREDDCDVAAFIFIADASICSVIEGKSVDNNGKTAIKFTIPCVIANEPSTSELMWVLDEENYRDYKETDGNWLTDYRTH